MQKTLGLSSSLCFPDYLVHIKVVPTLGKDNDKMVTAFIDKIITCEKPTNNSESLELVNRQIHEHSHTFRKKSKNECRFN